MVQPIIYKRATLSLAMKRLVKLLFFSVFSILAFSFVSAQITPQTPEDIIFRISSPTNAHGELYNGAGNYGTPVFYSDVFGAPYSGTISPANIHLCSGTNLALRLSANTNGHGQAPDYTGTAYPTDVCYGGLTCISSTSACVSPQVELASLSSSTNGHIENAGSNNYNTRICCVDTSVPQILSAKWLYYNGEEIPANANVCSANILIARAQTAAIGNGQTVQFDFFDYDAGATNPDDYLTTIPGIVSGNNADILFPLSDPGVYAFLQTELPDGDSTPNALELYFRVTYGTSVKQSVTINFQNDSDLCSFEPPQANIEAPIHRGVYFANTEIPFTSGCSSQIGPIVNEWTVTPQNGQPFTRTENQFNHTFTQAGQVNVKLKCTDLDGRFDVNESQMLVVASPYVLAYVNRPKLNEITYTSPPLSGPYFPNEISFSASDSFVVDTSGTNGCTINCLGGDCPIETENSLASCGASGGPIPIVPQASVSYSSLFFNWTFMDSDWTSEWAQYETGNGIYTGFVQYNDTSNSLRDKKVLVNVRHISGASAEFEREFTLGRCLNNGNTYYSSELESYSTNEANGACKGGDNSAGTADDCCATGLQCLPGTSSNPLHSCQIPPGGIIVECEDFITQSACNGNTNPAIPQASYGGNPPACTSLRCQWSSITNSCGLNVTTYQSSSTTGACSSGPGGVVVSSCSYTTTTSACLNGRKTITYATTGGSSCVRSPVTVPCGSLSFELGFFALREFLLSILLIGAIYLVFNFRKEIVRNEK